MNKEEARQKEAERTLKRIKGTLHHLNDGSAWEDPISENEEFQRMKQLVQAGYSHDQPNPINRLKSLVKRPASLILLIIIFLVVVELMLR
ncbi:MAG: hypothetical protein LJE83_07245 [Gammaproteobacteria bacterium]|nr:hypothetical protein [Gammaproteobacteria bacterium]